MEEPPELAEPLVCLMVAPAATSAARRQSEALFGMALRSTLRRNDVVVVWARKLADPVATAHSAVEEVGAADFVLAEVSSSDPIVFLYLGIAKALGVSIVALRRTQAQNEELLRQVAGEVLVYELTSFGLSELNLRLQEILRHLEEERRKGASMPGRAAEGEKAAGVDPSSLWKDLAFTATHSIGNSLFPIEVYLGHLLEIGRREGLSDAEDAASRALANLEKAKQQVERFKSLSADTAPRPEMIDLLVALSSRVEFLRRRNVEVSLFEEGPEPVWADRVLVDECLDELVSNSLTWLDGASDRRVTLTLRRSVASDLPPCASDPPRPFLLLAFEDSGPGVPQEDKERIFDLFYSSHPQGKGIGLAAVRKNLRRMGGDIRETGTPGHGAVFELFLPLGPQGEPR